MAGELIAIVKGGKTAQCEAFQLAAMEAKGWKVAPLPEADPARNWLVVGPPPDLFPIHRDGKTAWCDRKCWPDAEKAGWIKGRPEEADEEHVGDLRDVLAALDPSDDEIWNAAGTLKLAAFNDQFGRSETRETVERAWPGFNRDLLTLDPDEDAG